MVLCTYVIHYFIYYISFKICSYNKTVPGMKMGSTEPKMSVELNPCCSMDRKESSEVQKQLSGRQFYWRATPVTLGIVG